MQQKKLENSFKQCKIYVKRTKYFVDVEDSGKLQKSQKIIQNLFFMLVQYL